MTVLKYCVRLPFAALMLALAGCGGGKEGEELAVSNSTLSPQQIDAALGPADQSAIRDSLPGENAVAEDGNSTNAVTNSPEPEEDEQ